MLRTIRIILACMSLLAFSVNSNSQSQYVIPNEEAPISIWIDFISERETQPAVSFLEDLDKFVHQLEKKSGRYNHTSDFLRYVYFKVHRKYLRHYQTPSTFKDLVNNGTYDCLTGTALYSMVLEKLGFDHSIVETTYHIYLKLQIENEMVLIESTSPLYGFIKGEERIKHALEYYQNDLGNGAWTNQKYYKPVQTVNNTIGLTELAGLQYFNQAAKAYNQHNLTLALSNLSTALEFYPSARLKEMMVLMLDTLEQDPHFDPLLKQEYLSKFEHLRYSIITAQIEK